jgi:hypothetical protein
MDIRKQVCSLEQGKRLQELGIATKSVYQWQELVYEEEDSKRYKSFALGTDLYGSEFFLVSMPSEGLSYHWSEGTLEIYSTGDWHHSRVEFGDKVYPAYTVAELGEMLPGRIADGYFDHLYFFGSSKKVITKGWEAYYQRLDEPYVPCLFVPTPGTTEAEARAAALIYLLENDWIDAEKLNSESK